MSVTGALTPGDALQLFLLDCQARRLTPATLTFYRNKVGSFLRWLADNEVTELDAITSHAIKRWLVHMQQKGLTDHSQHDYARAVKTFLGYCVRDEILEKSPFIKVKMPQLEESLPVVLTDDEIKTVLLRVKAHRNRLIIRFILDSGIRAAELLALNVGDVDLATGIVVVKLGKQQKGRLTSIGAATRKAVKRYLLLRKSPDAKAPLIATMTKKATRLTMVGLMHAFRKMQGQTGVDTLTAHTLRRTMATKSLENGMDAYVLARMLGHADMQMLRRYVAMNRKLIQQAGEMYSVVDNLE